MSTPSPNYQPHLPVEQSFDGNVNIVVMLDAARTNAIRAITANDFATARKVATQAMFLLATIPDGQMAGLASQTWDRPAIQNFLLQLDRLEAATEQAASGVLAMQPYQYSARRVC